MAHNQAQINMLHSLADDAEEEGDVRLAAAKLQATDNTYPEGSPEYENLIEGYAAYGLATGLRFAADVPPWLEYQSE